MTPSQYNNMLRQAQQKHKQAIDRHNRDVRSNNQICQQQIDKINQEIRRENQKRQSAVSTYNTEVRKHNARVHANRARINLELNRLKNHAHVVRHDSLRNSAIALNSSFGALESREENILRQDNGAHFLDLSENESANSLAVANAFETSDDASDDPDFDSSNSTNIDNHLREISKELDNRWKGALFSLDKRNPDASRHFCTSAREIFSEILTSYAPNNNVVTAFPDCEKTDHGQPTRGSKIRFILSLSGIMDDSAVDFVNEDINNILKLFHVFNDGTHGSSGHFSIGQLSSIKSRVEDGIIYLSTICKQRQ